LALARGDLDEANQIIKAFRKTMKASQSAYERGLWTLLEGRYYLLRNESEKAILLLKESRDFFIQDGRNLELQWSIVWLTAAYDQSGKKDRSSLEMNSLLSRGATHDHAVLVAMMQAGSFLMDLQNDPIIGRTLSGLIERSQRFFARLPAIRRNLRRHINFIQIPSASLIVHAFGQPEVSLNGRLIPMSEWRTQSVRDLFFYLLYRQNAMTKEQIGADLWPETHDAQGLKARFKNDIYRLRRALGRDVIVFDDELYRFNRRLDYEYDVEAFDSHIYRAYTVTDVNARIEHLQKAVDFVQGPYLADVDAHWAVTERERLSQVYANALEELAYLYLNNNQLDQCLTICRRALKRDRFHETIYQIEMRAHAVQGDRLAVARLYHACKSAMEDLGVLPSPETQQIYRELAV
jgi:two-component SAPR family response regulator